MAPLPLQQFIQAVAYCHTHNVAHRDLKLDNTLLADGRAATAAAAADSVPELRGSRAPARIKLCDFGFAKQWSSDDSANMMTLVGCAGSRTCMKVGIGA